MLKYMLAQSSLLARMNECMNLWSAKAAKIPIKINSKIVDHRYSEIDRFFDY